MKVIDFEVAVHLGKNIEIIERTRYNLWDILGDVGGFNDGLYLVFELLFSSYAAFSYKQSILKNVKVDSEALKKTFKSAQIENSVPYQSVIDSINSQNGFQCQVDTDMISVFSWGLKRATSLRHSFFEAIKESFKTSKRKKFKNRIMDRIDRHIDIRNIIEGHVTLNILLRRTFTKQ